MHKKNITILTEHTIIKRSDPALMRIEVEKTRRAYQIGKDCSLFRVPKILEYDEANGEVVFERLNIKPIFHALSWGNDYNKLGEILGRALAIIHRYLLLPDNMRIHLPSELSLSGDAVFLHGDLGTFNVCIGKKWPPITIIDWQMTPMLGGEATYGTRYFDLIWFITNLICRPTIRQPQFFFTNPILPVAHRFLTAYFREAKLPYEAEQFIAYAQRFYHVLWPEIERYSCWRVRLLFPRCRTLRQKVMELLAKIPRYQSISLSEEKEFE